MNSQELLRSWQLDPKAARGLYLMVNKPAINSEWSRIFAQLFPNASTPALKPEENLLLGEAERLKSLRDALLEFFPSSSRKRLAETAIGYVLLRDLSGYAGQTDTAETAIGINFALLYLLNHVFYFVLLLALRDERKEDWLPETDDFIYDFGQTLALRHICASLDKCMPPFFFAGEAGADETISGSRLKRATAAFTALETAQAFVVAHEMSHISLGHTDRAIVPSASSNVLELEADREAARVVALWLAKRRRSGDLDLGLELHLGAIAAVVSACEAVGDIISVFYDVENTYPSWADRLTVITEEIEKTHGRKPPIAEAFLKTFFQTAHVCKLVKSSPRDSLEYLADMRNTCMRLGDSDNAIFLCSFATFIGSQYLKTDMSFMASQIAELEKMGGLKALSGINMLKL